MADPGSADLGPVDLGSVDLGSVVSEQRIRAAAAEVVGTLSRRGLTVAVAESLTGGLVCARLVDVPGASAVLRGGVVAYATDLKAALLGVDPALLAEVGAVHPDVAVRLAQGARARLGADLGVGTTGVAGPDPQDGRPPGTAYVAVAGAGGTPVRALALDGDRAQVRAGTVLAALELLLEVVATVADQP